VLDDAPRGPVAPLRRRDRAAAAVRAAQAQPGRVAAAGVAAVLVAGGAWWSLRPPDAPAPETLLPVVTAEAPAAATAPPAVPPVASTIVVHVAGAVARPGVLHLPVGSRVIDAIDAAGGVSAGADTDRVNLAAPLADGGRIQVPRVGEAVTAPVDGGAAPTVSPGPLDINQASALELEELPGIGPATAAAIVAHRERHGPFASVEALGEVSGIGDAKLAQLRELVRV
jgi:competence protein ComEA